MAVAQLQKQSVFKELDREYSNVFDVEFASHYETIECTIVNTFGQIQQCPHFHNVYPQEIVRPNFSNIYAPKLPHVHKIPIQHHCQLGGFGRGNGFFAESSGITINAQNDIIIADSKNHRRF